MKITLDWPDQIPITEYDREFLQYMLNRVAISYFKYGAMADGFPKKYTGIESARLRLNTYEHTKNKEFLVDAANFCMIEFMHPSLQETFFKATDSDESPGRVTSYGTINQQSNIEKYNYKRDGD